MARDDGLIYRRENPRISPGLGDGTSARLNVALNKKSKYRSDTDQQPMLFVNGRAFEMTWNQMVTFMTLDHELGLPNVFNAVKLVE